MKRDKQIEALVKALDATGRSSHPPGGRRHRRAEETRLRLFRTAMDLFAEHGFSSVTVGDITEAADVGKGTFFNYFESKDHVLGVMGEIQLAKIREAARRAKEEQTPIREVLYDLAHRLMEEPGRSPELARALIASFVASDVVRGIIRKRIVEARLVIAQLVEQGQRRGEIAPELKKRAVALQLQQAVMGTILLWSLEGKPSPATRMDSTFEHFWRAVAM